MSDFSEWMLDQLDELSALKRQIKELGAIIPAATGGTFESDPPDAVIEAAKRYIENIEGMRYGVYQ